MPADPYGPLPLSTSFRDKLRALCEKKRKVGGVAYLGIAVDKRKVVQHMCKQLRDTESTGEEALPASPHPIVFLMFAGLAYFASHAIYSKKGVGAGSGDEACSRPSVAVGSSKSTRKEPRQLPKPHSTLKARCVDSEGKLQKAE
jgi:hypothetical protein